MNHQCMYVFMILLEVKVHQLCHKANRYFKKMSFDFHILYDFIIHTLQHWHPVNLITVTPISHKYANTIQTS